MPSDYNVYESRDPSCQLMKCHAVTTLPFTSLAATVPKSDKSKAKLKKKERKTHHDLTCHATGHRHLKTADYENAKIPEISVDSSYQNIWDHLWKWSSYFDQPKFSDSSILTNRFIIIVLLLTYVANSEKEYMKLYKLVRARLLLFHRM